MTFFKSQHYRPEKHSEYFKTDICKNMMARDYEDIDLKNMTIDNYLKNTVVMLDHGKKERIPIARTAAMEHDGNGKWNALFEFLPDDPVAERTKNAWQHEFINAASINALTHPNGDTELLEWSIVAVPSDPDALRDSHIRMLSRYLDNTSSNGDEMDEKQLETIVERAIQRQRSLDPQGNVSQGTPDFKPYAGLIAHEISQSVKDYVGTSIKEAFSDRDKAEAEKKQADDARLKAEAEADQEKKKSEEALNAKQQGMEAEIQERSALLFKTRSLLPDIDEKQFLGMSKRDILLRAVGNNVEDAANKPDAYLEATADWLLKNRNDATQIQRNFGNVNYGNPLGDMEKARQTNLDKMTSMWKNPYPQTPAN